jgi:hypothetical protein
VQAIVDLTDLAAEVAALVRQTVREELSAVVDDGWLDAKSTAAYLDMSVGAVNSATSRGQLPCHRTGTGGRRYRRSELDAWATARDPA